MIRLSKRVLRLLRSRPAERSTEAGRARVRNRRVVLTLGTGVASRVVQLIISLIMVRLLLDYLGGNRYGIWATITSIVAVMGLLGRGVGDGLVHFLAEAEGKDDPDVASKTLSSAVVVLVAVALVVILGLGVAYPFVNWAKVLNIPSDLAASEAGPAVAVLVFFFAFNSVANIVPRVELGLQLGYLAAIWQMIGSAASLIGALVIMNMGGGLSWLAFAVAGLPGIMSVFNGLLFFGLKPEYRRLLPRRRQFRISMAVGLVQVGGLYLLYQTFFAISTQMDNLLTIHFYDANAVTELAVPMKLLTIINAANVVIITALWPAYKDAITRKDRIWVERTFKRTFRAALVLGLAGGLVIALGGRTLVHFWVGDAVAPSTLLLTGAGVLAILLTVGTIVTSVLNAADFFLPQVKYAALMLVATIVLKVVSLRQVGIDGLPWAMAFSYGVFYLLPALRLLRRSVLDQSRNVEGTA